MVCPRRTDPKDRFPTLPFGVARKGTSCTFLECTVRYFRRRKKVTKRKPKLLLAGYNGTGIC